MTPLPVYTFVVNSIDYQTIYSQPLPNSVENIVKGLREQAVYVPFVSNPLKDGDAFTLYGSRAQTVHNMFIGKGPRVLELVASTNDIPSIITKDLQFDPKSLPASSALSSYYDKYLVNCSGRDAAFFVRAFASNGEIVDFSLKIDGVQNPSSPSSSFLVNVSNRSVLCLSVSSNRDFYVSYTDLYF